MEIPAKDVMKALQLVQEISAVAHRAWVEGRRLEPAEIAAVDIRHALVEMMLSDKARNSSNVMPQDRSLLRTEANRDGQECSQKRRLENE